MRRTGGFTLVEMLVALSIFSMLITLLMTGFSQGLSMWERGNAKSFYWLSTEYRHELLRQLFFNARLSDYRGQQGITYPHFFADENQVAFTTRAPVLDLAGRIRPVRIILQRDEDGVADFYYQEAGRHNDQGRGIEWDQTRRVVFLEELTDPQFRFLAPAFPLPPDLYIAELTREEHLRYRDEAEWLDWYDTSILWKAPLLVELTFTDKHGDDHRWAFRVPTEMDAWSLIGKLDD